MKSQHCDITGLDHFLLIGAGIGCRIYKMINISVIDNVSVNQNATVYWQAEVDFTIMGEFDAFLGCEIDVVAEACDE